MNFRQALRILTAVVLSIQIAQPVGAQTLRTRVEKPGNAKQQSKWPASMVYAVTSDYADNRSPRGYTHSISGTLGYNINEQWSLGTELGLRAETIKGQIEKGKQETYAEVLNPSAEFELSYGDKFMDAHGFGLALHGEPLFDEPSRLEGYKGIVGTGGSLTLNFFGKRYSFMNAIDASSMINTYRYSSDGSANPDSFYTYRMNHSVRFLGNNKLSVGFGAKVTKYLDGFTGYSYKTSVKLSHSWQKLTLGGSYENGGFTDDGTVNLWYIDEYRRIFSVMMSYAF